jgi:hypothetical protein
MMSSLWPNPEYERRWNETISDDPGVRRGALDFWARRLDELPAPVRFTVPKAEHLKGQWQRVMRVSTPYCACGERRWLLPEHTVHFHAPEDYAPITIGAGRQLALGAWGADTQQTQIQVSVQGGFIVTHMLPYSTLTHAELMAIGVDAIGNVETAVGEDGRIHIRGIALGGGPVVRDSLEKIARELAEKRRPINRIVGIRIEGTNEVLNWVMYQMTKADLQADTMEVVVSATVQVMDRSQRASPHVCS